jgi:hypothetical protein
MKRGHKFWPQRRGSTFQQYSVEAGQLENVRCPSRNTSGSASAFTPVGLLVVIGAFATLASLLRPFFPSAKLRAKQVACSSNMKLLCLASEMYVVGTGKLAAYSNPTLASGPRSRTREDGAAEI